LLRHVSDLIFGHLQGAHKFFSVCSLHCSLYGRNSTYRSFATRVSQLKICIFELLV